MANMGLDNFNARVKRIKNPRNKSYYDPDLGMHVPKRMSHDEIRKNAKLRQFSIVKLLVSLIIGVVAMMTAQALRLRYLGMTETSNASLFTDILLALFFVLTLSALMRYRKVAYKAAQILGAAAMLVAGHNLMWYYPDELAIIYTADYVAQVREQTQPMSLIFRDMTISL